MWEVELKPEIKKDLRDPKQYVKGMNMTYNGITITMVGVLMMMIQYQGACGSCGSSLGATLSFMEQALRKDIYNELIVVPNM